MTLLLIGLVKAQLFFSWELNSKDIILETTITSVFHQKLEKPKI